MRRSGDTGRFSCGGLSALGEFTGERRPDLGLGVRPDAATLAEPRDQTTVARDQYPGAMFGEARGRHERIQFS